MSVTSKDVYNSAEDCLKTLDAAPTGAGTVPEGLDKQETLGEVTMADGTAQVMEHSISYSPANGYVRVEEFCAQHLDKLREFLVSVFEECLVANFTLQRLK
jgi:hypothetical protein